MRRFSSRRCFSRKVFAASSSRVIRRPAAAARRRALDVHVKRSRAPRVDRACRGTARGPRCSRSPSAGSGGARCTPVVSMRPRKRRRSVTSSPQRSGPRGAGRTSSRLRCQRGRLAGSVTEREDLLDRACDLHRVLERGHRPDGGSSPSVRESLRPEPARRGTVTVRAVAPVKVMLLGPPRVERDGAPVAFDTRKAMALLAHLALADRPRPRDALAELLWPEHDAEHARGALRRTLSTLRGAIGAEALEATRDRVQPRPRRRRSRSTSTASARSPPRASSRRRSRCSAATSSRASGCATRRRSRTGSAARPTRCGASSRRVLALADGARRPGDLAARRARRWLELDPLHEPAHRALIRLYARSGDRAAALAPVPRVRAHALPRARRAAAGGDDAALRGDQRGHARGRRRAAPPGARAAARRAPRRWSAASDDWRALLDAHRGVGADGRVAVLEGEAGHRQDAAGRGAARARARARARRCCPAAPTRRSRRSPTARSSRRCARGCARTRGWLERRAATRALARRRGCCPSRRAPAAPPPLDGPGAAGALPRRRLGDARRRRGRPGARRPARRRRAVGRRGDARAARLRAAPARRAARCSCC